MNTIRQKNTVGLHSQQVLLVKCLPFGSIVLWLQLTMVRISKFDDVQYCSAVGGKAKQRWSPNNLYLGRGKRYWSKGIIAQQMTVKLG